MGMTIEQKITTLLELYHFIKDDTHFCGYNEENATQSLETAIETMRKYQKIEQIVSDFRKYQKGITWGFGGEKYMQMVSEVVEDGKVD